MNNENATFEAKMQRLEQIVRAMERGDVALEESLNLFQEGTELVKNCSKMLDEAELQVKKVMTAADGTPVLEDMSNE
ncbi:MAG: exodeoxyribonuclease VII small subunit [Oscillospiraceae bacterium]|nr:exodeoxyribonuclease VII small subunit [Oscillospiraceae bacterium]